MNLLKLEPGDIIVHEQCGELTILKKDLENKRYFVDGEEIVVPAWISFEEVKEVCENKK